MRTPKKLSFIVFKKSEAQKIPSRQRDSSYDSNAQTLTGTEENGVEDAHMGTHASQPSSLHLLLGTSESKSMTPTKLVRFETHRSLGACEGKSQQTADNEK